MIQLFFQEPDVVLRYGILLLAVVFSIMGAAGYRKIAVRGLLCSLAALCCGLLLFAITGFLGLIAGGKGEGAAIGAILLGIAAGGIGALVSLAILLWRFVWRPRKQFVREGASMPFAALAILSVALAATIFYTRTPALQSDRKLAQKTQKVETVESQYAELARRGRGAVPEIIQELRNVQRLEIHEFESARNSGTKKLLILLGQARGPEAVAELRTWLQDPDAAADIRGIAALALAEAGDQESAAAIAALLQENSYEWHKQRPLLFRSLARMKATGQVNSIAQALMHEDNEIYRMDAAGTLIEIGGREGWGTIERLMSEGTPEVRDSIRKVLELSPPSPERDRVLSIITKK